jgi:hypothetical protein
MCARVRWYVRAPDALHIPASSVARLSAFVVFLVTRHAPVNVRASGTALPAHGRAVGTYAAAVAAAGAVCRRPLVLLLMMIVAMVILLSVWLYRGRHAAQASAIPLRQRHRQAGAQHGSLLPVDVQHGEWVRE